MTRTLLSVVVGVAVFFAAGVAEALYLWNNEPTHRLIAWVARLFGAG